MKECSTATNMTEKTDVKTLQASFPPGTLGKIVPSEKNMTSNLLINNFVGGPLCFCCVET